MDNNKKYTRRDFLKIAGAGSAALSAAAMGCSTTGKGNVTAAETPEGEMTYRTNPGNGDRVSLLGYGCMRWPMKKDGDGKDVIDQETVNGLVDYAMQHGVNYYDTSPVYVQGQSERASAIALGRHPRNSYYLATKLSNFSNWSRENSMLMYRKSFENMETDYFDYYLLHSIGNGGTKMFEERYFDNGMADFLMKEREAGRIRNLGFSFHGTQETFDYAALYRTEYSAPFAPLSAEALTSRARYGYTCIAEQGYNGWYYLYGKDGAYEPMTYDGDRWQGGGAAMREAQLLGPTPCERIRTVSPSPTSSRESTGATPCADRRATTCGL